MAEFIINTSQAEPSLAGRHIEEGISDAPRKAERLLDSSPDEVIQLPGPLRMLKDGSERIVQFGHDKISESLQFHPVSETGLEDLFSTLSEVCRKLIQTSFGIES